MEKIPVSFDFNEKIYIGHFTAVSGSGANVWHLIVDGYYWGQLWKTENFGWQFANSKGTLKEFTDHFAQVVTGRQEKPQDFLLFFSHSYN